MPTPRRTQTAARAVRRRAPCLDLCSAWARKIETRPAVSIALPGRVGRRRPGPDRDAWSSTRTVRQIAPATRMVPGSAPVIVLVLVGSSRGPLVLPLAVAAPLPPARPGDRGDRGLRLPPAGDADRGGGRLCGSPAVQASTLAVGGAFTAVLLGLAASRTLGRDLRRVVLQTTRPFRVSANGCASSAARWPARWRAR